MSNETSSAVCKTTYFAPVGFLQYIFLNVRFFSHVPTFDAKTTLFVTLQERKIAISDFTDPESVSYVACYVQKHSITTFKRTFQTVYQKIFPAAWLSSEQFRP